MMEDWPEISLDPAELDPEGSYAPDAEVETIQGVVSPWGPVLTSKRVGEPGDPDFFEYMIEYFRLQPWVQSGELSSKLLTVT